MKKQVWNLLSAMVYVNGKKEWLLCSFCNPKTNVFKCIGLKTNVSFKIYWLKSRFTLKLHSYK